MQYSSIDLYRCRPKPALNGHYLIICVSNKQNKLPNENFPPELHIFSPHRPKFTPIKPSLCKNIIPKISRIYDKIMEHNTFHLKASRISSVYLSLKSPVTVYLSGGSIFRRVWPDYLWQQSGNASACYRLPEPTTAIRRMIQSAFNAAHKATRSRAQYN